MKIILNIASTINGFIAIPDDRNSIISNNAHHTYLSMIEKTGCMIVGRMTFEVMRANFCFENVPGCTVIVLTTDKEYKTQFSFCHIASSPEEALSMLEKRGFESALLLGGGKTNASFVSKKLIDEICINIEPKIIPNGIPLFSIGKYNVNTELMSVKKINDTIELHYTVVK
ncbi:MAG: dihydrofolate reductase [bacterium]